jgi:hypothetical protein
MPVAYSKNLTCVLLSSYDNDEYISYIADPVAKTISMFNNMSYLTNLKSTDKLDATFVIS